jgi:predicted PurR-regulated permease PerM
MASEHTSTLDKDYLDKSLDIAVRLGVIAIIILGCLRIFSPFLVPVVWGMIIAIALHPIFAKLVSSMGGRRKMAGAVFILVSLALLIVPTVLMTDSVIDGGVTIGRQLEDGTFKVPPPDAKVKDWPVVGESLYEYWNSASVDLEGTATKLAPQLKALSARVASLVAGLGATFVQMIFALIIAGVLMVTSEGGDRAARVIAMRLGGDEGVAMVDISVGTIRSVVKGVILVAVIQALLAAIGLYVASVPMAGFWALLVMIVAVIQLPPILILGPIAVWVFSANDSTVISVGFLIWSLLVSGSDSFLKPLFLGRGVKVPMLVILVGAIGGMLRSGVIGLFIGPVILAIGYGLFRAWIAGVQSPEGEGSKPEPAGI